MLMNNIMYSMYIYFVRIIKKNIVIYKNSILIGLNCFYIFLLSVVCINAVCYSKMDCSINKEDDLKYFYRFNKNLSLLEIPSDLIDVIDIKSCNDYEVLSLIFNSKLINDGQLYIKPNICPPTIQHNTDTQYDN